MTKNAIIEKLFLSKNFNDCLSRMEPEYLREDLKQEVIAIVCEWSDEKVIGLHTGKQLEFTVVRIILNQIQSNTSPFYKKFRQYLVELDYNKWVYNEYDVHGNDRNNKKILDSLDNLQGYLVDHPIDDINEIIDRHEREQIENNVLDEIEDMKNDRVNNARYYKGQMIGLYQELGNFRAIEAETQIPFISCYKVIKQSFQELKEKALSKVV